MRPVERGPVPLLPNGQAKTVRDYKDWRFDLIDRLGHYCSYCEMPLHDSPQVEHVSPKSGAGSLLAWDNMLLACGPCNSTKSAAPCLPATHFLPDFHNTHLAFTHKHLLHPKLPGSIAGIVVPRVGLSARRLNKARATIVLCGLDRVVQTPKQQRRASDLRWRYRFEAIVMAERYRAKWDILPPTSAKGYIECLEDIVQAVGFFSVWLDAFSDVPRIKQMLVGAFPHTAACFPPPAYKPTVRVPRDL